MVKIIRLLGNLKWYHFLLILAIICLVYIQVTCDLKLPEYYGEISNRARLTESFLERDLLNLGFEMLMYVLIGFGSAAIVMYISGIIGAQFATTLRSKMFAKVQSFSLEEKDKFSTASLITRSTNDIRQVAMVVTIILRIAISAPIMAIKGLIQASNVASSMNYIIVISVIVLVVLIITIFIIVLPKFSRMQKLTDRLNLVTRENLTGLRVVRAFNAEKKEKDKFEKTSNNVRSNNIFVNRMISMIMPGMMLIMNGASLAIIWIGAILLDKGEILYASEVIVFQQYAMIIVMSFLMLVMVFIMAPRGIVAGRRIDEVLKTKTKIEDSKDPITVFPKEGEIEFSNVFFKYPGAAEEVLCNISFKVKKGETIAFIGSTGSGKSTIINMLPRFFDATEGNIYVNGVNIKDISQHTLREMIGFVPQKGVLFSGDIMHNMLYGKNDATKEEVIEALKISQAYDFVNEFENKLEQNISQGGTNVSGGQRQRLAIARALVKKPQFYIFDDSFSALDFKTDKNLRRELNNKTKESTKLIVAQRVGTIMDADKIIVLEKGKIVGTGTHEELLKSCDVYYEIASSQLGMEVKI